MFLTFLQVFLINTQGLRHLKNDGWKLATTWWCMVGVISVALQMLVLKASRTGMVTEGVPMLFLFRILIGVFQYLNNRACSNVLK